MKVPGLALGMCAYPPRARLPRHAHEHARLVFTLHGSFTERYERKERECKPMAVVFRPPGENHAEWFHRRGGVCLSVDLDPQWMDQIRDYGVALKDSAVFPDGGMTLIGARLCRELADPDSVSALAIEATMLEAMAAAVRLKSLAENSAAPRWLFAVREVLHARFAERLELSALAKIAGVHPGHVARGFRRAYRCSVGDYVRQLRVGFACQELTCTGNALGHIAAAAGFSDQSHLTRVFRLHMGMTPARYRALFAGEGRSRPCQKEPAMQDSTRFPP